MGYVYVIDRANGHLKIGFSQEPFRRLSQVSGAIKVLAVWAHDNARAAEAFAHRLLAAHRQDRMPDSPTTIELPPGFSWTKIGDDYVLTSPSGHRSAWRGDLRAMSEAAWAWHHDVRPGVPRP